MIKQSLIKTSIIFSIIIIFASCAGVQQMPSSYPSQSVSNPEIIEQSLFNANDKTISEEDIQRLLNGQIKIGDSVRIAIFNYSSHSQRSTYTNYYYYRTDEEYLKTQQSYIETLRNKLNESEKTQKIILMPSIMADKQSSITNLREIAVRLQADLLLVYNIKSDIYYKYKTFKADEAKAFATVECFIMDTRTGVIPFTTVTTRENFKQKTSDEISTEELRKNTEKEAVIKALEAIGLEIYEYLDNN
jgi:hypothetical protein